MAENQLIIGSLPVLRGAYDAGTSYYRDNQVTMYGSTFQSLTDGNMSYPPAELREDGKVYAINTDKWIIVANAIEAYNAGERISALEATFSQEENPEYVSAVVDAEGRVLFGLTADGRPYFPKNDTYRVESNEEWLAVWLDAAGRVLFGVRRDGSAYVAKAGFLDRLSQIEQLLKDSGISGDDLAAQIKALQTDVAPLTETFSIVSNEEWLHAVVDAEGRVLEGTQPDGRKHFPHQEMLSKYDDPEGRTEMTLDAAGRILSYRDRQGVKHETAGLNTTNIDAQKISLSEEGMTDFQKALIASGFNPQTPVDWSNSSFIQIPEPRFAMINVSGIEAMPTSKTDDLHAWLEFWDMQGNYFKKRVIANAQGSSSMSFIKKNAAFDFCDDEWEGEETPSIRIGDWVPQDSFHMKAYYTDFFRGVGVVCYKLYEEIVRTRGNMYDRPWKKALIDMSKIGTSTKSLGNSIVDDYELQTDTGARCFPDGFPVVCYLNGEFYGIFSWQLKKHRDNYHLDKKTPEHVHLDGYLSTTTIFNGKENIDWTQFEVRNPKDLYTKTGNEYDADKAMEEIAGEEEVTAWEEAGHLPDGTEITEKIQETLENTAKVKTYIEDFADVMSKVIEAMNVYDASDKSPDDMKTYRAVFEKYFDPDNIIDYLILSDLVYNIDGFGKNWQWFTYDGIKWYVGLYDCDMSFGGHYLGNQIFPIQNSHISIDTARPQGHIVKYYTEELEKRYKELSDEGIISSQHIFKLVHDWTMRIGTDFYKEEYDRWPDTPCISDSVVREDYWEVVTDGHGNPQTDDSETFDATHAYTVGETVSFGLNNTMGYFKFKCVSPTEALESNTPHAISAYSPIVQFKHCDNLYRIEKWIEQTVKNMDSIYNYTR